MRMEYVDYVARGIDWASGHAEVAGRILHLYSGPEDTIKIPILMRHVRAFMRASTTSLEPPGTELGNLVGRDKP